MVYKPENTLEIICNKYACKFLEKNLLHHL